MSAPLRFTSIAVRRMPGFARGGPRLDDLSPGVNLVCGANASGKTTLARALQAAVWSRLQPDASIEAFFELDGAAWLVDVAAGRAHWQRAGSDAPPPAVPPADNADRYYLSLHGLLVGSDADLAECIRVESAGGYDVRGAAAALGFGTRPSPRGLMASLRAAELALRNARDAEDVLRRRVARLDALRAEQRERAKSAARLEPLQRALDLARAAAERSSATDAVAAYPPAAHALAGNELERLDDWRHTHAAALEHIAAADDVVARAAAELAALGLGDEPLPAALLVEAGELLEQLRRCDDELGRARSEHARAGERLRDAVQRVLALHGDEPAAGIRRVDADRLDGWLRRAEQLRRRRIEIDERIAALEPVQPPEDEARILAHAELLRAWLREGAADAAADVRARHLAGGGIVALVGIALLAFALAQPIIGAVALGSALVLLLLRPPRAADPRPRIEEHARAGGCEPRGSWTRDTVTAALAALERRAAAARLDAERADRARSLRRHYDALEADERQLSAEREAVLADLGIEPAVEELSLYLLATKLNAWLDASTDAVAAAAAVGEFERRHAGLLTRLDMVLAPFGYPPGDVATHARSWRDLQRRREAQIAALAELDMARQQRARGRADADDAQRRIDRLFAELGLSVADEATLRDWCARLDELRSALRRLHVAEQRHAEAEAALRALAHPDELLLRAASTTELEALERAARAAVTDATALVERIAALETELRHARRKHDVEDALALVAAKQDELSDRREEAVEAAVGEALAEWLAARIADQERPAVFHHARRLFTTITRGRYRLELAGTTGAFRAFDSVTQRGHSLDELSSGTRVQLLLAVRMAFVETQESAAALPLLLDEVLANSDDQRAAAIIDAAIALARAGRQVFYFTAQPDEVAKWHAALETDGTVPWCMRMLRSTSEDALTVERPAVASSHATSPDATGLTHDEYGRALDVPPFDPWAGSVGSLHLWYLIDDPQLLHALLAAGIERWGQLDLLVRSAATHDGAARAAWQRARPLARLAERFRELWRVGRCVPVDSAVLERSGAVSDAFAEPVEALRRTVGGDGASLIAALESGGVKRFRSASVDELRSFFEKNGHIASAAPHDADYIRSALLAEASALYDGAGAPIVDAFLARLTRGPVAVLPH